MQIHHIFTTYWILHEYLSICWKKISNALSFVVMAEVKYKHILEKRRCTNYPSLGTQGFTSSCLVISLNVLWIQKSTHCDQKPSFKLYLWVNSGTGDHWCLFPTIELHCHMQLNSYFEMQNVNETLERQKCKWFRPTV